MPKRTDHPHTPPSPTLANIAICPGCQQPVGSPTHVCAPKAVQSCALPAFRCPTCRAIWHVGHQCKRQPR